MGRAAHRGRFADQCARGLSSTAKTVSFNSGGLPAAHPPKSRQRCLVVSSPHRHKHPRERPKRVLEPARGGWKLPRPTELTTNSLFFRQRVGAANLPERAVQSAVLLSSAAFAPQ